MTQRDDVLRLEREFADAMQRLYSVGNGLAALRVDLDRQAAAVVAAPPAPVAPRVPAGPPATAWVPPAPGPAGMPPVATVPPPPAAPREPWYRREGAVTRVLAVSGAVITLAGVAMLLVLAYRQGWFGPPLRVAAGAVLALALGSLGLRGGGRELAASGRVGSAPVALVATGAAAAYLDVVAVTSGYGWVPPVPGLALSGGVAVTGLALARRWDSELLAVLTVAGAAGFAPVVAHTGVSHGSWVVAAFLAVLSFAGWWAGSRRTRPLLTVVRTVPVVLALLVGAVGPVLGSGSVERGGLLAVALTVLLASVGTALVDVRRDPADVAASLALGGAVVAAVSVTAALPDPARPVVHGLTALLLLLVATATSRPPLGPLAPHLVVTAGASASLSAVLAVVSGARAGWVGTGLLVLAVAHAVLAGTTRSRAALALTAPVSVIALLVWTRHPLATLTVGAATGHDLARALLDSMLAGALAAVAWWATGAVRGVPAGTRSLVTVGAWAVGLASSATALVAVGTVAGSGLDAADVGFTAGHALATVSWIVVAAWLVLRSLGRARDAELALRSGLVLAAVSVAKLFLFDLAALDGVVRSVAFLVTGLVLLATGSRYAREHDRRRADA